MSDAEEAAAAPWPEPGLGERLLGLLDSGRPAWRAEAACRGHDVELFFPTRSDPSTYYDAARAICSGCPVREDCLEAHLAEHHGCWGGLSPPERVALRRRRGLLAPRRRPECR